MTATRSVPIDAVIYDFGGVFMASPFEAIRTFGEDQGIPYETALAVLFGSYDSDDDHPWHRCERGELGIVETRDAILALAEAQDLHLDLFEVFKVMGGDPSIHEPMVESVRRARAAGCKTAILTNNFAEARAMWRPMLPLDELFDVVVDSSEVGMRKPNPAVYHHTLEALGGVPPSRAVFLDDYPGNVRAAEAIGMHGIVVENDRAVAIAALDALLAG